MQHLVWSWKHIFDTQLDLGEHDWKKKHVPEITEKEHLVCSGVPAAVDQLLIAE